MKKALTLITLVFGLGFVGWVFLYTPGTSSVTDEKVKTETSPAPPIKNDSATTEASAQFVSVRSSSTLPESYGYRYDEERIIDGDLETWWSPNSGDRGSFVELYLKKSSFLRGIEIHGGSHFPNHYKLGDLYLLNYRIENLVVECYSGTEKVLTESHTLIDEDRMQPITFRQKVKCDRVVIYPKSLYRTKRWKDICISEVRPL